MTNTNWIRKTERKRRGSKVNGEEGGGKGREKTNKRKKKRERGEKGISLL